MVLSLLVGIVLTPTPHPLLRPFDFYAQGPYEAAVPRPETILGYGPGERHSTFREQELTVLAIANAAKGRVVPIQYGKSTAGRPLRVFAISSPKNISRIEEIRKDLGRLANAEGPNLDQVIARTPAVVWINQCIHGDETASFESAMWLLYNLAASKGSLAKTLDDVVVILNPVYNPDGHERYVVFYNSIAVGSSEPGAFETTGPRLAAGRTNQYRFDMNRDRVAMSQDETRQEVLEFLRWNPHVYVDQHGQTSNYFFPPNPMSINANVDRDRLNKWTEIFGRATATAFDKAGWTYYIKDQFDFYYPGYLDSWTGLSGAIGITHETDGGRVLARLRPDGSTLTLRDGMEKHFTSALAVIRSSAENRSALVTSYAQFKRKAVSGESAGKFQRVVVTSDDPRPLVRLQTQLGRSGIRSGFAKRAFKQADANNYWTQKREEVEFPAGSLVIDMAQSQGPLAKALLEIESDFEPEFLKAQQGKKKTAPEGETYPGPDGTEFYDLTGWSLVYAHNLKGWWCESAPKVEVGEAPTWPKGIAAANFEPVGYALRYRDQADVLAVHDVLAAGVRGMVTRKPMKLAGKSFPAGTFLFMQARNDDGFEKSIAQVAMKRGVQFEPIATSYPDEERYGPGTESVLMLRKPKIGIVFGSTGTGSDFGPIWYLMEREFKLPFTPLTSGALSGDLSDYTCIVVPGGGSGASASGKFREWISAGGSAVALEDIGWAVGSSSLVNLETVKGEVQDLPGALFRAELDPRSILSYGYYPAPEKGKIEIAVPVAGGTFYTARKEGGSVVSFSNDEKVKKLLTGWAWPDDTEKNLRNVMWAQEVPVGRGVAFLFRQDPCERAMWPGLYKMLLSAMIVGPSQ